MNIAEKGNNTFIQVFQQFFKKYPDALNYDQKEKLQKYVKHHEYRLTRIGKFEYITETTEHRFVVTKNRKHVTLRQPATIRSQKRTVITEEDTAIYLLYVLILQDTPRIITALQLANRTSRNLENWLKFTRCNYHIPLPQ